MLHDDYKCKLSLVPFCRDVQKNQTLLHLFPTIFHLPQSSIFDFISSFSWHIEIPYFFSVGTTTYSKKCIHIYLLFIHHYSSHQTCKFKDVHVVYVYHLLNRSTTRGIALFYEILLTSKFMILFNTIPKTPQIK